MGETKDKSDGFKPDVILYTDGGCCPNPGPGGWAYVLLKADAHGEDGPGCRRKEGSGAVRATTNQRMELRAAIEGLKGIAAVAGVPTRVLIRSDSEYLVKGMNQWVRAWEAGGWRKPEKNRKMWRELWERMKVHVIRGQWIGRQAGWTENIRCHGLAERARQGLVTKAMTRGDVAIMEGPGWWYVEKAVERAVKRSKQR